MVIVTSFAAIPGLTRDFGSFFSHSFRLSPRLPAAYPQVTMRRGRYIRHGFFVERHTNMATDRVRMTVPKFTALKAAGQKITMLTAYDYRHGRLVDAAGVEGILVGDSLSMVVQGHDNDAAGDARRNDLPRRDGRPGGAARAGDRRYAVSQLPPGLVQGDRERRADPEGNALPGGEARRGRASRPT